jgi:hypothetical protein
MADSAVSTTAKLTFPTKPKANGMVVAYVKPARRAPAASASQPELHTNNGGGGHRSNPVNYASARQLAASSSQASTASPPPGSHYASQQNFPVMIVTEEDKEQVVAARHAERERETRMTRVMMAEYAVEQERSREKQLVEQSFREMQELRQLELADNWRREREQRRIAENEMIVLEEQQWRRQIGEEKQHAIQAMQHFEVELAGKRAVRLAADAADEDARHKAEAARRDQVLREREHIL